MQQEINIVRSLYYPVRTDQFSRMGHRIIATQSHILIFGGISPNGDYNASIIKIDCETMTLDLIHSTNSLQLQNFSLFTYNGQIYFWGGSAPKREDPRVSVCQRKLLKFDEDQFVVVEQRGCIPSARECHSSCMVSSKYLIIMGGNNGKSFFNDWHILECNTMTWSALQLDEQIPPFLDAQLFWNYGRGFLLTGDFYDVNSRTLCPGNRLYQFRFKDFREKKVDLQVVNVSADCKQRRPRGSPSAVLVNLESPYLMLIGGSYLTDKGQTQICNQIECLNLETLEWFTINSAIKSGLGFQSLYYNEKVYLIGGVTNNREVTQFIEYIELKVDYLESKVCKICREVYGMKQYNIGDRNSLAIKIQADSSQKTFFSSEIIGRMASYIGYPFSALGLLIDNSLNLSGTNIDITFDFQFYDKMEDQKQRGLFTRQNSVPYNYISIIDNSFGFTQHQILECLNSFSIKTEKLTSDKRYEEEIQIRKQYGINLKLGALRLGKSCLYMTRTEDRSKLFAYFSISSYYSSNPFTVYTYTINPEGCCSSQINRKLIRQNVRGRIPLNYEDISAPTLLFIFDIKRIQLNIKKESGYSAVYYRESANKVFRELEQYLSSLYLNPYIGRRIAINGKDIKFRSYLQTFKKDQQKGVLVEVDEDEYPKELFSCFCLYKVQAQNYFLNSILCYQKNRLLFGVPGIDSKFCGVVELSEQVKVDICKTKIQDRSEQLAINRIIRSVLGRYELKRVPKGAAKPPQPSKERMLDWTSATNSANTTQSTLSLQNQ